MIDVPSGFIEYIPQNLLSRSVTLTQVEENLTPMQLLQRCTERYELLRDHASLVITTRYHIATPCCAMGIPVIMVENNNPQYHWTFDPRLSALTPHIPFYTKEQWGEVDWNPQPADYEDVKQTMTALIMSRIKNAAVIASGSYGLSCFLDQSKKRFWNTYCENRHKISSFSFLYYFDMPFLSKINGSFKFYLYGLSNRYIEQKKCKILDSIQNYYPEAEFLGFVDSQKRGTYFGKEVLSPDKMKIDINTYCLVSAYTANDFAAQLFENRGLDKTHLWPMPKNVLFWIYQL